MISPHHDIANKYPPHKDSEREIMLERSEMKHSPKAINPYLSHLFKVKKNIHIKPLRNPALCTPNSL